MYNNRKNIKCEKRILDFDETMDYADMMRCLDILCDRYDGDISVISIGKSIFGREIPMICLGKGKKEILYVGAARGTDILCTSLLLRFINEYCEIRKSNRRIYNLNLRQLEENRTVCVIPMLNPDGVDYVVNGVNKDNPFYSRLLSYNHGNNDFSMWEANGRGVDLCNNFATDSNIGFESMPESEPESGALGGIMRFNPNIKLLLEFRHGCGRIVYTSMSRVERERSIAQYMGRISGFAIGEADLEQCSGSLMAFGSEVQGIPSYTVFCGETNSGGAHNFFKTYVGTRELMFVAPIAV